MPTIARLIRPCSGLAASLTPVLALAQTAPASSPGVSGSNVLQAFIGLLIILGLLLSAAYLMRRIYGGRPFGQGPMKLLGGIAVGNRERIVLVEVEDTWLVVGIGPGQIRTLHTLPKGTSTTPAGGQGPAFGDWLKAIRERQNAAQ